MWVRESEDWEWGLQHGVTESRKGRWGMALLLLDLDLCRSSCPPMQPPTEPRTDAK